MKIVVKGNLFKKAINSFAMKNGQFGLIVDSNPFLSGKIVFASGSCLNMLDEVGLGYNIFESRLMVRLYTKGSTLTIERDK